MSLCVSCLYHLSFSNRWAVLGMKQCNIFVKNQLGSKVGRGLGLSGVQKGDLECMTLYPQFIKDPKNKNYFFAYIACWQSVAVDMECLMWSSLMSRTGPIKIWNLKLVRLVCTCHYDWFKHTPTQASTSLFCVLDPHLNPKFAFQNAWKWGF